MAFSDFRIGWRLLARQPMQSAVELLGLATGFAICFLLLGFVAYSFTYDRDVPDSERVFVIKHRLNFIPQPQWMEYTPFPIRAVALQSGLPLEASVWWPREVTLLQQGRPRRLELTTVDPAFERIAGLKAVAGDLGQALTRPDGLALTRQTARQLFGDATDQPELLGRSVTINGQTLQVLAILPDRPGNSTIQFGALVGIGSALWPQQERDQTLNEWMGISGRIYVKTEAGVSAPALQAALQGAIDRAPWKNLATPEMTAALGERKMVDIALGPLSQAYFDRSVANTMGAGARGDLRMVLAMGLAGLLILGLALVNYVNLATLRTLRRQREIAVRRVLGAGTGRLLTQFMAESVLLSLGAAALGLLLAWLSLPLASELLQRRFDGMFTPATVAAALGLGALAGALAGLYPGWLARGVNMGEALSHRGGETAGGAWLRRALTALQCAVAMATGSVALAILWQAQFAGSAPPGFDPAPLLAVEMDRSTAPPAARALREALARLPGVAAVADSKNVPGRDDRTGTRGSATVNRVDGSATALGMQFVGPEFFQVYGLAPLAGRLFDPRIDGTQQEQQNVVLNRAALKELGWASPEQALGQRIDGSPWRIIGVAPDIRWGTLREPVRPLMYQLTPDNHLLTLRLRGTPSAGARAALEPAIAAIAARYFPGRETPVRPVAAYYEEAYADDLRLARLLACATLVVFALAAFGMYALAASSVQRRAREIVMRKLHGAGKAAVARLVAKEFVLLTVVAALIGLPAALLAIQWYLAPFAQHSPRGAWAPVTALVFALVIVAMATARHTLVAMRMSPLRALGE